MTTTDIQERFKSSAPATENKSVSALRLHAFNDFNRFGIPGSKNEEWKYTRISSVFNRPYSFADATVDKEFKPSSLDGLRLPGHELANELLFINGIFSFEHSTIRSSSLVVMPLEEAATNPEYEKLVAENLGHSARYLKDGINALNAAFVHGGVFMQVKKGKIAEHPIYLYHIVNGGQPVLAQPRSLLHLAQNAQAEITETYFNPDQTESFTNQVMEIVVEKDARLELYKIQNDAPRNNQVSTTHIRQVGRSYTHVVTVSLNGGIVRNNLNVVLEAEYSEAHLYGLYFQQGETHIDNHTVVDNRSPNCLSNELYKGVIGDKASAVFNGKIYVQPQAQKTNAYQSNKNILLSPEASVNTKPQLEIFADDVKCSHGCTIGQLNEDSLFYLQSRGIDEEMARSLLVHAFAVDILEFIKPVQIREYVNHLISTRLSFDVS